jgi:hypothetical protein
MKEFEENGFKSQDQQFNKATNEWVLTGRKTKILSFIDKV